MIVRRIVPAGDAATFDTEAPDARDRLKDWYRPESPASIRLTMISSLDGRAAGRDGTSESLTSRLDRMILGVVREWADVVVVGAETVRREGYLLPRRSRLAIITASGDLTGHRLDQVAARSTTGLPPQPVLVITTASGAARASRTLATVPHELVEIPSDAAGQIPLQSVLSALRDRGGPSIVCEGGPQLAAQFLSAGLVDEVCLTVAPHLGGPDLPLLGAGALPTAALQLRQLVLDESGMQYGRWARAAPSATT